MDPTPVGIKQEPPNNYYGVAPTDMLRTNTFFPYMPQQEVTRLSSQSTSSGTSVCFLFLFFLIVLVDNICPTLIAPVFSLSLSAVVINSMKEDFDHLFTLALQGPYDIENILMPLAPLPTLPSPASPHAAQGCLSRSLPARPQLVSEDISARHLPPSSDVFPDLSAFHPLPPLLEFEAPAAVPHHQLGSTICIHLFLQLV